MHQKTYSSIVKTQRRGGRIVIVKEPRIESFKENHRREAASLRLLKKWGLRPALVNFDYNTGIISREYIGQKKRKIDLNDTKELTKIVKSYAQYHEKKFLKPGRLFEIRAPKSYNNYFRGEVKLLQHSIDRLRKKDIYPSLKIYLEKLMRRDEKRTFDYHPNYSLIAIDASIDNWVVHSKKAHIIDWGMVRVGDPAIDIAGFAMMNGLSGTAQKFLIREYSKRTRDPSFGERIRLLTPYIRIAYISSLANILYNQESFDYPFKLREIRKIIGQQIQLLKTETVAG